MYAFSYVLVAASIFTALHGKLSKPNIVLIVADDMGKYAVY